MNKQILATVGAREITVEDLNLALKHAPKEHAVQLNTSEGKKHLLNEMIIQEMFYLDAKEKEMDKDVLYLKELEVVKANLLKQYAVERLLEDIRVDADEARKYYDTNPEQFTTGDTVRVRHILLKDEETAEKVLSEIQKGEDFEEAAKTYSHCPSKSQGGDLGYFEKGRMVPEFEEAAFSLEKGEISGLIKTQFGYHIIKVEDKKSPSLIPFEGVKKQIEDYLLRNKQNQKLKAHTDGLRGKYDITVNEELLR